MTASIGYLSENCFTASSASSGLRKFRVINPIGLMTLNFLKPEEAAEAVKQFSLKYPIDAVIPVDEETAVVAAAIGQALNLPHNSIEAAYAARNKYRMRQLLRQASVPEPDF